MNGKPHQTKLIAFYDDLTSIEDEARTVDIVYVDFSKVFSTISHLILI